MIERYCITLEQAKKLSQYDDFNAAHHWLEVDSLDKGTLAFFDELPSWLDHRPIRAYPAYHVGELLEMLPNEIDEGTGNYFLTKQGQVRGYLSPDRRWLVQICGTRSEAEAFGDLLIYLIENKLI